MTVQGARVRTLQKLLEVPGVLVSDPANIFYYSGYRSDSDGPLLLVRKQGRPLLFLSPLADPQRVWADIRFSGKGALEKELPKAVGFEEGHLPAGLFLRLRKGRSLVPAGETVRKPREIKGPEELERMRKAIGISARALARLPLFGRAEREVARAIELEFYRRGGAPAFETIVASGAPAGAVIHHVPGRRQVRRGEMVIVDFGARWQGYCADITRTWVPGRGRRQRRVAETVQELQEECIDRLRPGVPFREINEFHESFLRKRGFEPRHGIGHGIGLEVHEPAGALEKGMVVTIEPGIYLKGLGGCRIEDMVLMGSRPRVLTRRIPRAPWG